MAETIDLNRLLGDSRLQITAPEHPDERAARLRVQEASARIDRHKDIVRFYVLLMASVIIFAGAIHLAFWDATASAETKRWATAILAAIVTGPGGFLLGQRTK